MPPSKSTAIPQVPLEKETAVVHKPLTHDSARLHVIGDLLGSAGAVAAALIIQWLGWLWADPAISIFVALLIVGSASKLLRRSAHILLEGTPSSLQLPAVREAMQSVEGVLDVHDLHVWSLGSSSHALASHITIAEMPMSECSSILDGINCALRDRFHIHHTTIQFETTGCETLHGCSAPPALEAVGAHGHHHHGHNH